MNKKCLFLQCDCPYVGCGESYSDHSTTHAQVTLNLIYNLASLHHLPFLSFSIFSVDSFIFTISFFDSRQRNTIWQWIWPRSGCGVTSVREKCFWNKGLLVQWQQHSAINLSNRYPFVTYSHLTLHPDSEDLIHNTLYLIMAHGVFFLFYFIYLDFMFERIAVNKH